MSAEDEWTEGDEGPNTRPAVTWTVRRFVAASVVVVATVAIGWMALSSQNVAEGTSHHEFTYPEDYIGTVWFAVDPPDDRDRAVEVEWGRLTTTVTHEGEEPMTYFFDRGGFDGRLGPLLVDVTPPAEVSFSFGVAPVDGVDIGATPWEVLPVTEGTTPPEPAGSGRPMARASVNEWVSYGLNVVGVSIRTAPELGADRIGSVMHGEVYRARCWTTGEAITNGNYADPSDDAAQYTTDVWYEIETDAGWGFISDVWFARRAEADRLNLPECDEVEE